MKHYFIVSRSLSPYHTINVAIREKFEDAKEVIKTTSNWYEKIGSGYIREIDENFHTIQHWRFSNNQIVQGPVDKVYKRKNKKALEEGEQ